MSMIDFDSNIQELICEQIERERHEKFRPYPKMPKSKPMTKEMAECWKDDLYAKK